MSEVPSSPDLYVKQYNYPEQGIRLTLPARVRVVTLVPLTASPTCGATRIFSAPRVRLVTARSAACPLPSRLLLRPPAAATVLSARLCRVARSLVRWTLELLSPSSTRSLSTNTCRHSTTPNGLSALPTVAPALSALGLLLILVAAAQWVRALSVLTAATRTILLPQVEKLPCSRRQTPCRLQQPRSREGTLQHLARPPKTVLGRRR